jgi:hypothetical protein
MSDSSVSDGWMRYPDGKDYARMFANGTLNGAVTILLN